MAIRKTDNGTYVMSAYRVWRPGCFDSERTARIAQRRSDEQIDQFREVAIARNNGVITEAIIREVEAANAKAE